jgi:hypothetical protein
MLLSEWWSVHRRPWKGFKCWRRNLDADCRHRCRGFIACPCMTRYYRILLLDMRMNNYEVYKWVFITCMFWFIRLIHLHCLYMTAEVGGLMFSASAPYLEYFYQGWAGHPNFPLLLYL